MLNNNKKSFFTIIGCWLFLMSLVTNFAYAQQPPNQLSCGNFRTQTQGGWGSRANGNNPGVYRDANFANAFPNGLTIGCSTGFTIKFNTSAAIKDFLPQGGSPAQLTASYVMGGAGNPVQNLGNVFAGQVLALSLSVGFDLYDANFGGSTTNLKDLILKSGNYKCTNDGKEETFTIANAFNGWTVAKLLEEANKALGGCMTSYNIGELNSAVDAVNNAFVDGTKDCGKSFLLCSPPVENLNLTSLCSDDPNTTRRWRITNPNSFAVEVSWRVHGTAQTGTVTAEPGNTFFFTNTVTGANTTIISWFNEKGEKKEVTKASNGWACGQAPVVKQVCNETASVRTFEIENPNVFDWAGSNKLMWTDGTNSGEIEIEAGKKKTVEIETTASSLTFSWFTDIQPSNNTPQPNGVNSPKKTLVVQVENKLCPKPIRIFVECVKSNSDGTYTATFGYLNENSATVEIPVGNDNKFSPAPQDRGQTISFQPGRVGEAFSVNFDGSNLVWTVKGPDGSTRTTTASKNSKVCPLPVRPVLECVRFAGNGVYIAVFGYSNENATAVEIPVGDNNKLTPNTQNALLPTTFLPGRQVAAFEIPFDGSNLVWTLKGPDGSTRTSTANANSKACPVNVNCGDLVGKDGKAENWLDKVTLTAKSIGDANFTVTPIHFSTDADWKANSAGVGVMKASEGGNPNFLREINYVASANASEILRIDFGADYATKQISGADVLLSRFYTQENNKKEQGYWVAKDGNGNEVGQGSFTATAPLTGDNPGHYNLTIRTCEPFRYLEFSAGPYAALNARVEQADDSDYAVRELTVVCEPQCDTDLAITKTCPTGEILTGDEFWYTLQVSNLGKVDATNVTVTDVLPSNVQFVLADNGGVEAPAGTVKWTLASLAKGASITLKVKVIALTAGTGILNQASVAFESPKDTNKQNNQASCSVDIKQRTTDVSIKKNCPKGDIYVGYTFNYTLTVTNAKTDKGGNDATNVTIVDELPANVVFVSANKGGTYAAGKVTWVLPSLAAGKSETVTVIVKAITAGTMVLNSASVSIEKPVDSNDKNDVSSCTIDIKEWNPEVKCEDVMGTAKDIAVNNSGLTGLIGSWLSKVKLDAKAIGDMSFSPIPVNFVTDAGWKAGSAGVGVKKADESGSTFLEEINYRAEENTSEILRVDFGTDYVSKNITGADVLLSRFYSNEPNKTKAEQGFWEAKDEDGNIVGSGEFVATQPLSGNNPGYFNLEIRTCKPFRYLEFSAGPYTTVATARTETVPDNSDYLLRELKVICEPVCRVDLTLTKRCTQSVVVGQEITYTIVVTNTGKDNVTGVSVEDMLPEGVEYVAGSADNGGTFADGKVTWTGLSVSAESSITLTFRAKALTVGAKQNNAKLTYKYDANVSNNADACTTTVTPIKLDVSITKECRPTSVILGRNFSYRIVVKNNRLVKATPANTATNLVVTDVLPAGVTFVSATPKDGYTYDEDTRTITWIIPSLGDNKTVTFNVTVNAQEIGNYPNEVSVAVDETTSEDVNKENNNANCSTVVFYKAPEDCAVFHVKHVSGGSELYTLNVSTGDTSIVRVLPGKVHFAVKDGFIYAINESTGELFTMKLSDGSLNSLGIIKDASSKVIKGNTQAAFNFSGELYIGAGKIYKVDLGTLIATSLGNVKVGSVNVNTDGGDQVFASDGTWYMAGKLKGDADDRIFKITGSSGGNLTAEIVTEQLGEITGLALTDNGDGDLVASINSIGFKVINPSNGAVKKHIDMKFGWGDMASCVGPVRPANVSITKNCVESVKQGENITYTLTITNTGSKTEIVDVKDFLPSGATFVSASDGGTYSAGVVTWTGISVGVGAGNAVTLTVEVTATQVGSQKNTAKVITAKTNLSQQTEHSCTTEVRVRKTNLSITKTASKASVKVGENFTYTLKVKNEGEIDAVNTVVSDDLPAEVEFVASVPVPTTHIGNSLTWNLGTVAPSTTKTIIITVKAVTAKDGVKNIASVTTDTEETTTDDNSDDEVVDIKDICPAPQDICSTEEAFAIKVTDFKQGKRHDGKDVATARSNPNNALFMPQNDDNTASPINYVSLGFGGSIDLELATPVYNWNKTGVPVVDKYAQYPGEISFGDLIVVETSYGRSGTNCGPNQDIRYPERARFFGRECPEQPWVLLGEGCRVSFVDVANIEKAGQKYVKYLRIVDISDKSLFTSVDDGYDVDGVIACPATVEEIIKTGSYDSRKISRGRSEAGFSFSLDYFNREPNAAVESIEVAMMAYPNPSNGRVTIDLTSVMENDAVEIHVYSALGELMTVKQMNLSIGGNKTELDMSNFANGMYIIKTASKAGASYNHIKIIKE
jgi:uncharacterized repeat protein (TIGR01451 family)